MLRSIEIENEYASDDEYLTDGREPIVGKFHREFVRDRKETEVYGYQIEREEHSDFDATNAYLRTDRKQRQDWDYLLFKRSSHWTHTQSHRPKGTSSALEGGQNGSRFPSMETRDYDMVGRKDLNGNKQRIQRELQNRPESERDHSFTNDTNLVCNWLPLSAKFRRQQSEPSSSRYQSFYPDEASSFPMQHPATSDGHRSSEDGLTFIPCPVRSSNRTGTTPPQLVSPHKGLYLHPFKDSSVVTQGQVVNIQVQRVGGNSDSGSEGDCGRDSRMINAQLTPREFGYGCSLTFENDEEEVFNDDVSTTLPAFQNVITGRSTKDSGINLSEIDEHNVSPVSPLSSVESPNDATMRQEEKRNRRHGQRGRYPVQEKIHSKTSAAGATVYLPHQSSSAGHSGIAERPLTTTPRYEQNRNRRKNKAPGVERVRSMSEHRIHVDLQIPVDGLPIGSAHERRSLRHKEMGGDARRASSNERKRGGEKHSTNGLLGEQERNCEARDVSNREKNSQRKLGDLQKVIVVNAEVEEEKNREGKVRGRSKQRKTRDDRHESVLHPVNDLDRLAKFFLKQSSPGTPDNGRNDKTNKNNEKPLTGLKGSPNATCKEKDILPQRQADPTNQHKPHSSGVSDNLGVSSSILMETPSKVCAAPRDPDPDEPSKRKLWKTKRKDWKEDPMRISKLSPSPCVSESRGSDGVAVLDHGRPPEGRGSRGSGDLRTPASSGVGPEGGVQQRPRSVSGCVAELEQSISFDGVSNVELPDTKPIPADHSGNGSTTDGALTGAKLHVVDEQLKKEVRLESASCAVELHKNASQTSDKSPLEKPNFGKVPEKPTLPISVGAAEIPVSSKSPLEKPNSGKLPEKPKLPISVGRAEIPVSSKSPLEKPNSGKLPEKPKLPISIAAVEIPVSSKVSQDVSPNLTDQVSILPPPPGFRDEASNFPPITSRDTVRVESKPPVPLPKLKPRIYQKKSDRLSPEPPQLQPIKLPWIRNKPSPPVPSKITPPKVLLPIVPFPKIPLSTLNRLQIASTGKECNNNQNQLLIRGDSQTPSAMTGRPTDKPPDRTPDAAQNQQVKIDDSKDVDFAVMAETFRKNYVNRKLDGDTAIKVEPHAQHAVPVSSIQSLHETLQAHKHESTEKALTQNAVNDPERTPKIRPEPVAIPNAQAKMEIVPIGTKAEASVTAELPKGRLVETALPKEEARIQPKLEPTLAPDDNRNPCLQGPCCLPAPPEFCDSTDTIAGRTGLSQTPQPSRSPSSVVISSDSVHLVNTSRYLTCPIDAWTPQDVGEWLESLGLGEHRYRFVHNSIDGIRLKALDRNALVSLKMTNHLHRMHLERARMSQMRQTQQQSLIVDP